MIADSPTPPQPCTASQSPALSRPCTVMARNAVANRQPRQAASTKLTASGSATRFVSTALIATSSANEPGPVKPGWVCCGHTCASPARQYSHIPQPQTNGTVTRSPAPQPVTCDRLGPRSRPVHDQEFAAAAPDHGPSRHASRTGTARSRPPRVPRRRPGRPDLPPASAPASSRSRSRPPPARPTAHPRALRTALAQVQPVDSESIVKMMAATDRPSPFWSGGILIAAATARISAIGAVIPAVTNVPSPKTKAATAIPFVWRACGLPASAGSAPARRSRPAGRNPAGRNPAGHSPAGGDNPAGPESRAWFRAGRPAGQR